MSAISNLAAHGLDKVGHHGSVAAMGVPREQLPSWDDIQLLTAQLHRPPLLDKEPVNTETVIGPKAKKPLKLDIPLFVSDMSFGALSLEAKTALSKGAELAGTGICSGEGGMLDEEQSANSRYFYELASAKFKELGIVPAKMSIETGAGLVRAEVVCSGKDVGGTPASCPVCLELTEPGDLQIDLESDLEWSLDFVNTGVEHAVAWVDDLDAIDLPHFGKLIREHALFSPAGTNANFARVEDDGTISVRTYERGVEGETLACGTGATAVALLAAQRGWIKLPATVHCAGGFDLVIDSSRDRTTLTGGAVKVFEGTVEYGNRV